MKAGESVSISTLLSVPGVTLNVVVCGVALANLGFVDVTLTYSLLPVLCSFLDPR